MRVDVQEELAVANDPQESIEVAHLLAIGRYILVFHVLRSLFHVFF